LANVVDRHVDHAGLASGSRSAASRPAAFHGMNRDHYF
jgi:hypothetical protein